MDRQKTLVQSILDFWFVESSEAQWFKKDHEFDARIKARFEAVVQQAMDGNYDDWSDYNDLGMALILVLDQFPRNIYRNDPLAFAGDEKARKVARQMLDRGADLEMSITWRKFLYLPLEHSEDLQDQADSVLLFETLGDAHTLEFAIKHQEIIERFGRFPHRNAVLGRASTEEELAFLEQPGSSF